MPPPPPPPPPLEIIRILVEESPEAEENEVPFVVVEEMPMFPGGDARAFKIYWRKYKLSRGCQRRTIFREE